MAGAGTPVTQYIGMFLGAGATFGGIPLMALDAKVVTGPDISDEIYFARLWNADTHSTLMSEIFGVKVERVYDWARRHKLRPRTPQGRTIKIHRRDFIDLWSSNRPVEVIAAELRCTAAAIKLLVAFFDLQPRAEPRRVDAVKEVVVPSVSGAPFWTLERDNRVRETGGRYGSVAALAADLGVASPKVLGRWHQLRVV